MITPGLWHALPTLVALAAALADWRAWMGEDFAWASHFLRPTGKVTPDYPCTGKPDCGCRHELERLEENQYRWACCCGVGNCPAVTVPDAEVRTYELDVKQMAAAVVRALGFELAGGLRGLYAGPHVRQVGSYGRRRSPVFLVLCANAAELLESLKQIASVCGEPFIVLAPTARERSKMVASFLEDLHSAYIPVAPCVRPGGAGEFQIRNSIEGLLGQFRAGLGNGSEAGGDGEEAMTKSTAGAGEVGIVSCGRLRYSPGFEDVWVGDTHYDLRDRKRARLCIQYLVQMRAFDADSARHLIKEIDPYVRKHGDLLPSADIKIDHYFSDHKGVLPTLRKDLIASAGRNRCFFLRVK